jgi:hypothetical protein
VVVGGRGSFGIMAAKLISERAAPQSTGKGRFHV